MRRHLLDVTVLWVVASIACGYVVLAEPTERNLAIHVYVLLVGGLVMLAVVATFGDALPRRRRSAFREALVERQTENRAPAQVELVERQVALGVSNAYDLHRLLLPQLREIAQCRLERSGRAPGPDTLGDWWELLRPDRPEPEDRFAPGISQHDLRALVADLERM